MILFAEFVRHIDVDRTVAKSLPLGGPGLSGPIVSTGGSLT